MARARSLNWSLGVGWEFYIPMATIRFYFYLLLVYIGIDLSFLCKRKQILRYHVTLNIAMLVFSYCPVIFDFIGWILTCLQLFSIFSLHNIWLYLCFGFEDNSNFFCLSSMQIFGDHSMIVVVYNAYIINRL